MTDFMSSLEINNYIFINTIKYSYYNQYLDLYGSTYIIYL